MFSLHGDTEPFGFCSAAFNFWSTGVDTFIGYWATQPSKSSTMNSISPVSSCSERLEQVRLISSNFNILQVFSIVATQPGNCPAPRTFFNLCHNPFRFRNIFSRWYQQSFNNEWPVCGVMWDGMHRQLVKKHFFWECFLYLPAGTATYHFWQSVLLSLL